MVLCTCVKTWSRFIASLSSNHIIIIIILSNYLTQARTFEDANQHFSHPNHDLHKISGQISLLVYSALASFSCLPWVLETAWNDCNVFLCMHINTYLRNFYMGFLFHHSFATKQHIMQLWSFPTYYYFFPWDQASL